MNDLRRAGVLLAALLVPLAAATAQWSKLSIRLKDRTIAVELARTPEQLERGLMFRESLPPDEGMLFVFPAPRRLAFWMKNTTIPLSIAFLDARGVVRQVADMKPLSEETVVAKEECRFALEMNQGWFARHRIGVGDRLDAASLARVSPTP
jgi:uncharacterized membrane protein (UPF0127 family)